MTEVRRRKQCSLRGCRKGRVEGSEFCVEHSAPQQAAPQPEPAAPTRKRRAKRTPKAQEEPQERASDSVVKLDEMDALRFGKADAEIRNVLQGIQLADLQIAETQRNAQMKVAGLEGHKKLMQSRYNDLKPQYEELVKKLAKKYKVKDPAQMAIDPDTGTVRDLSKR